MKSAQRGESTSPVEVTHISEHGIWLLIDGRELFMPFKQFPWFRTASIAAVMKVELEGPGTSTGLTWTWTSPSSQSSIRTGSRL